MSEWDFTWGLTGKELEEAQSSGLVPDECGYAFDENEDEYEEGCVYCIRCQKCRKYMQLNIQAMTAKLNVHIVVRDLIGQKSFLNTAI